MVGPEIKSKVKMIGVTKNPVIIIGQNPGHNRDGTHTGIVWENNRSANLLLEALEDRQNLILTNICNYTEITEEYLFEGQNDIIKLYHDNKPFDIICLGEFSFQHIKMLIHNNLLKCNNGSYTRVWKLHHPSYIARFNKDKEKWINEIRSIIDGKN